MSSYLNYNSIRHVKRRQDMSESTDTTDYMDMAHAKMPYGAGEEVL